MAKELKDILKSDLIKMVENQQKEIQKAKDLSKELKALQTKYSDLEEENRLLMIQQEDDDVVNVMQVPTTPKAKQKKLTDMSEPELVAHMQRTLNKKIL